MNLSRAPAAAASLALLAPLFLYCVDDSFSPGPAKTSPAHGPAPAAVVASRLAPYAANPRYYTLDGVPRVLLGGASTLHPGTVAVSEVDRVLSNGGNYARVWHNFTLQPAAWLQLPDGRYDLTQWDETYWSDMRTMAAYAESKGLAISVPFFSEPGMESGTGLDDDRVLMKVPGR